MVNAEHATENHGAPGPNPGLATQQSSVKAYIRALAGLLFCWGTTRSTTTGSEEPHLRRLARKSFNLNAAPRCIVGRRGSDYCKRACPCLHAGWSYGHACLRLAAQTR